MTQLWSLLSFCFSQLNLNVLEIMTLIYYKILQQHYSLAVLNTSYLLLLQYLFSSLVAFSLCRSTLLRNNNTAFSYFSSRMWDKYPSRLVYTHLHFSGILSDFTLIISKLIIVFCMKSRN